MVKDVNHTMSETTILFQEEEFVLEPVDDTGQMLISFWWMFTLTWFGLPFSSENTCNIDYSHFRFHLLLLSEFHFTLSIIQTQIQVIYLNCLNFRLQFLPCTKSSFVALVALQAWPQGCYWRFTWKTIIASDVSVTFIFKITILKLSSLWKTLVCELLTRSKVKSITFSL